MTDRPIIFSAAMIRALLDGRKSMTRRILKPQPGELDRPFCRADGSWHVTDSRGGHMSPMHVPYAVGDRLWCREAHAFDGVMVRYYATDHVHELRRKRPSIHMPRWASRLTLIVTDVRVQRVQEISEADAVEEGVSPITEPDDRKWEHYAPHGVAFRALWNSIHGPEAWAANPWCVALTFETHRCNIDKMPEGV